MSKETRAFVTIEVRVPVTGNWARAEPDVGINEGWFEDAHINVSPVELQKILDAAEEEYADYIQEALGDGARDAEEEAADYRYDEMRHAEFAGQE